GVVGCGGGGVPGRAVITGIRAAVASAAVLGPGGCTSTATGPGGSGQLPRFFSGHQAAVVEDATARIAPGPGDDPAEAGHPGAREAGVTGYIDAMLGALAAVGAVDASGGGDGAPGPVIFARRPWSNRPKVGPRRLAALVA